MRLTSPQTIGQMESKSVTATLMHDFASADTAPRIGTPWERRLNGTDGTKPKSHDGYYESGRNYTTPDSRQRAKSMTPCIARKQQQTNIHLTDPTVKTRNRAHSEPRGSAYARSSSTTSIPSSSIRRKKSLTQSTATKPRASETNPSTNASLLSSESSSASFLPSIPPPTLFNNDDNNLLAHLSTLAIPARPKQPHRTLQIANTECGTILKVEASPSGAKMKHLSTSSSSALPNTPSNRKQLEIQPADISTASSPSKSTSRSRRSSVETTCIIPLKPSPPPVLVPIATPLAFDDASTYERNVTEVDIAWLESVTRDIDSTLALNDGIAVSSHPTQLERELFEEKVRAQCDEEQAAFEKRLIPMTAVARGSVMRRILLERVEIGRCSSTLGGRNYRGFVEALNNAIDYTRDYAFSYFGIKTLEKAYLLKVQAGEGPETVEWPQHLWMRVAFIHATPTLFNAGTLREGLSSCFLLTATNTQDSIEGIYDLLKETAVISKHSGGMVSACTTFVPKAAWSTAQMANKRPGSAAVYLEPWHSEILQFLQLKESADLFTKKAIAGEDWMLVRPKEAPGLSEVHGPEFDALYHRYEAEGRYRSKIPARDLMFSIIQSQIKTGGPFMLYKDHIMQYTSDTETAVCNLASIGLPSFVRAGTTEFDYRGHYETAKIVTKNLDRVIDITHYPVAKARYSNMRHRPLGLGVSGLADVFIMMKVPFESSTGTFSNQSTLAHLKPVVNWHRNLGRTTHTQDLALAKGSSNLISDRAVYIDQSQSMNLFLADPAYKKIMSMHFYAFERGLKTGMYYLKMKPSSAPLQNKRPLRDVTNVSSTSSSKKRMLKKPPPILKRTRDKATFDDDFFIVKSARKPAPSVTSASTNSTSAATPPTISHDLILVLKQATQSSSQAKSTTTTPATTVTSASISSASAVTTTITSRASSSQPPTLINHFLQTRDSSPVDDDLIILTRARKSFAFRTASTASTTAAIFPPLSVSAASAATA
ncbi:ribonucleoside-diphosphate reductase [Chytriomyces confervae]|uniref:Ribonucleoside-diphosphate reductase n=1 Tax=Chytriomyces confervae TaxID=246404 RepID=A0A507DKK2_9FUNG|nr:ribonucleoside-diphosphate reductase [Chytriomyces confervae]